MEKRRGPSGLRYVSKKTSRVLFGLQTTTQLSRQLSTLTWPIASICAGVIIEIIGLYIFRNTDGDISIYGARYAEYIGTPVFIPHWANDIITGTFASLIGSAHKGVGIAGIVLNGISSGIAYISSRIAGLSKGKSLGVSIALACLFMPPVGMWVGDHIGIVAGLSPFFCLLIAEKACGTNKKVAEIILVLSLCIFPALVSFKINSSLPAGLMSIAGAIGYLCILPTDKHERLSRYTRITLIVACGLAIASTAWKVLISHGVGIPLHYFIEFYSTAFKSKITERLTLAGLKTLPLGISPIDAIGGKKLGLILYLPLTIAWWLAVFESSISIWSKKNYYEKRRFFVVLFFLTASALCAYTLGRGHTHKVLFTSMAILIWIDIKACSRWWTTKVKNNMFTATWLYLVGLFIISGARELKDHGLIDPFPSQRMFDNKACAYSQEFKLVEPNHTCYSQTDWEKSVAGVGGHSQVLGLANQLNIIWRSDSPMSRRFHEEQDNRLLTDTGRARWVQKTSNYLKAKGFNFYAESFNQDPELKESRKRVLVLLSRALKSCERGKVADITIWKINCERATNVDGN